MGSRHISVSSIFSIVCFWLSGLGVGFGVAGTHYYPPVVHSEAEAVIPSELQVDGLRPATAFVARVHRVIDGDTVDVDQVTRWRIRLKDCWAPESGTRQGELSTQSLRGMLANRQLVVVVREHSMLASGERVGRR